MKVQKLKYGYFVIAIGLFYILTVVVADRKLERAPLPMGESRLSPFEGTTFESEELYFLFFYDGDSELSQKMRANVENLLEEGLAPGLFYAVDAREHPRLYYDHNVSGVPNILVFKEDKEVKRIMGFVSSENLSKIVKRVEANK